MAKIYSLKNANGIKHCSLQAPYTPTILMVKKVRIPVFTQARSSASNFSWF